MPTMKDIADLAGVSHGTVSNVVNKRGNVSVDKIRLVEQAARELGYNTNVLAQNLRKDQIQQVIILLPNSQHYEYGFFYSVLQEILEDHDYDSMVLYSENLISKEEKNIQKAISLRPEYIITFSNSRNPLELYRAAMNSGIKVIFINNPYAKPGDQCFTLSFDIDTIAREIIRFTGKNNYSRIAFLGDLESEVFSSALWNALNEYAGTGQQFVPFSYHQRFTQNGCVKILNSEAGFDLVLTADSRRANTLLRMQGLLDKPCAQVLSVDSCQTIPDLRFRRYELDFAALAHASAANITGKNAEIPAAQTIPPAGIRFEKPSCPVPKKSREIRLLTLASPTSEAITTLLPCLKRETGIDLNIIALPYEELHAILSTSSPSQFDMVRIDLAWLYRFAHKYCIPLKNYSGELEKIQELIHPSIQKAYVRQDPEIFTLPLDPSVQTLLYRKDLFNDAMIRRMYFETAHKQLDIPRTFQEYDEIARFFTRKFNPESPVDYGTILTYGSAAVAACDFLPRLNHTGMPLFDRQGNLQVDADFFKNTLNEYIGSKQYTSPGINYWWGDSMKRLTDGTTAMTVVFMNYASRVLSGEQPSIIGKIGNALVPGGVPLLGGGCIGILKNSANADTCMEFLKWVYSDETAGLITLLGGLSPCRSVYKNEDVLRLYPWLRNIADYFEAGERLQKDIDRSSFDDYGFEYALGMEVRNAALGIFSVDDAWEHLNNFCKNNLQGKNND